MSCTGRGQILRFVWSHFDICPPRAGGSAGPPVRCDDGGGIDAVPHHFPERGRPFSYVLLAATWQTAICTSACLVEFQRLERTAHVSVPACTVVLTLNLKPVPMCECAIAEHRLQRCRPGAAGHAACRRPRQRPARARCCDGRHCSPLRQSDAVLDCLSCAGGPADGAGNAASQWRCSRHRKV